MLKSCARHTDCKEKHKWKIGFCYYTRLIVHITENDFVDMNDIDLPGKYAKKQSVR